MIKKFIYSTHNDNIIIKTGTEIKSESQLTRIQSTLHFNNLKFEKSIKNQDQSFL